MIEWLRDNWYGCSLIVGVLGWIVFNFWLDWRRSWAEYQSRERFNEIKEQRRQEKGG